MKPSLQVIEGGSDFPSEPARGGVLMPTTGFWRRAIAGVPDHELRSIAWSLALAYEGVLVAYFEATGQHAPLSVILQAEISARPDLEGCESDPVPSFAQ